MTDHEKVQHTLAVADRLAAAGAQAIQSGRISMVGFTANLAVQFRQACPDEAAGEMRLSLLRLVLNRTKTILEDLAKAPQCRQSAGPRFKLGDHVIFNRNLDKSPDPAGARIVGVIVRYVLPDETPSGPRFPAACAFVKWDDLTVTPVMDDWLELAPQVEAARDERLCTVTVYDHPSDCPEEYVARRDCIEGGKLLPEPDPFLRSKSLAEIERQLAAMGMIRMPNPGETDRAIVSVWA